MTRTLARARFQMAPPDLPEMPDFITTHIDPFTGDDDTADIDAGTGAILSRLPPLQIAAAGHAAGRAGRRGAGAGEPQRAVPVRLGPQVQALPRAGGLSRA